MRRLFLLVSIAVVAPLLTACDDGVAESSPAGARSASPASSHTSAEPPGSPAPSSGQPLRYVVTPPDARAGWVGCPVWLIDCPEYSDALSEFPHALSLRVKITVPRRWEPDGTLVFSPSGSEAPRGAALVIGWTNPLAGLYDDPCQEAAHLRPDIEVGPTVDDFVDAVVAHPMLQITEPIDVKLGGYPGAYFELTAPSDISGCEFWRPFDPGIYAQGPNNVWSIWVIDVDGFRMIVLAEDFPATSAKDKDDLRAMVESIRFLP